MANLNVEILDTKPLGDGHVAFLARCDGDPMSDSWHTCAIDPTLSGDALDAFVDSELTKHQQRVAELHLARTTTLAKLTAHKGKTKTITI